MVHLGTGRLYLNKPGAEILYEGIMLNAELTKLCPVCLLDQKDRAKLDIEIINDGDLFVIAKKHGLTYEQVQDHAQHIQFEDIVPEKSLRDKYEHIRTRLEASKNPADMVYWMTQLMKERVLNIIEDESATGLVQIDRINKAIRENANAIGKLREQMREGDIRKIENLAAMVSIYRGVFLDLCDSCHNSLDIRIEKAIAKADEYASEIADLDTTDEMDMEKLPDIPEALSG